MALGKRKPYLVSSDDQHFVPPEQELYYTGVGAQLRDARLSYGRTTAEIGQVLRLKPAHLDALERGEIEGTPGLTYALGYLRSYAQYLGLDGEAAVVAFKAELNREPENRPLVFPAPVQEAKFPTGRVLSLSVVLAVLVYGAYYYISRSNTPLAEVVPAVPAELATVPEAPAAPVAATPEAVPQHDPTAAQAAPLPAVDVPAAAQPAPVAATVPALTVAPGAPAVPGALPHVMPAPPGSVPAPMPTDVAVPAPATAAVGAVAAVAPPAAAIPAEGRVVLKASASAWVQIVGDNQEVIFTRILRAGDTYVVPARPDALLVTGNAGAVEIELDGKSLGPLGTLGQVRRNIPLDPEKLLNGAAKPPA
ncbi:helix-turn-helix domain-containing protein [Zavarzinia aquatilis]|uniref:Cytoskeleton protein RodZ-like C-terminal domain-containing protein n=1 Tax=Zavarzinia aquatilis TaxID=2211142 RepID=A0A317EDH1_9PROT|nr:helix-turn-helix domain-containing protein [Zavarzinia aquatilis]PWR24791.1 hypothetical protein DKG74_08340 [Zavarzinia aquatilis]